MVYLLKTQHSLGSAHKSIINQNYRIAFEVTLENMLILRHVVMTSLASLVWLFSTLGAAAGI